ncbi:cohesin loading factor [Delphinella strobiligena]|nr:cohesin loading factor [Delphinella strobiligena]
MTESSRQTDLPVDYQVLLLALADEYISKAHSMASILARDMREVDLDQYHKLIASGLGCMESVLRNFKFPSPTMEARLVHRYCSLLFDETENDDVAHEMLTRTVKMCERHKLVDLRYSLIHLQLRFHFRSRPVAALKMLDQMLLIIEAYKHTSWDYAMRFLRVSLSLQMLQPDISGALQQLRRVSRLAEINNHVPILATSAALEALVHLRNGGPDAVQSSQRALAAARKHQLDPSLKKISQLAALLDCLDLCCDLISLTPDQAMVKMKQMQKVMDDASLDKTWRSDGSFCVPFGGVEAVSLATDIAANTGGVFERVSTGQRALVFRWIRRSELFSLGYLFSGIATAHKNSVDRKAERYLEEGSKISTEKYDPSDEQGLQSLNSAQAQIERRTYFHQSMLLHLALIRCNRSDWLSAKQVLEPLALSLPRGTRQKSSDPMDMLTIYLTGLIHQGTGDLINALANYQCHALSLKPGQKVAGALQELRLLAALNTILILQSDHSETPHVQSLLASLEQPCLSHPDQSFAAAYNLVAVSSTPGLPIIKTKNLLSTAMATAKRVANLHLICVTMNLMNATFFKDIVGEQAENSARVGQTLARKCANPLWCAVASGMLARTSELCGLKESMVAAREEGLEAMGKLPYGLIGRFQQSGQ